MTSAHWSRVKPILAVALELDADSRPAYLDAACGEDASLRAEVESFLDQEAADGFLEQSPISGSPPIPSSGFRSAEPRPGVCTQIQPGDLAPYTRLRLATRSSSYDLIVVAPLDLTLLVKGGHRFPELTRARFPSQHRIAIGQKLRLHVGSRAIETTRIQSIEVLR
jgi:hypothetical protein